MTALKTLKTFRSLNQKHLLLFLLLTSLSFVGSAQTDSIYLDSILPEAKTQTKEFELDFNTINVYAYHQECSLTTNNASRKWCTEVTLERIILQHYAWPVIKDSATFKKREIYTLLIQIDSSGAITDFEVKGGSNKIVNQAIIEAVKKSKVRFVPAVGQNNSNSPFRYEITLRAFDFISPRKGPTELQVPAQLTDEELEKKDNGNSTSGYRIN